MDYIPLLVSLISGGLAGAVVTSVTSRQRHRSDLAMSLVSSFFSIYDDLAEGKRILRDKLQIEQSAGQNLVRRTGDWLELVASLWIRGSLDKSIVRQTPIPKEIRAFAELVAASISLSDAFQDAKTWWPDVFKFEE